MPVTTLDKATALIIVDLQKGILSLPVADAVDDIVARSRTLADAFRHHGLPVVLVNVAGLAPGRNEQARSPVTPTADWTEFAPGLAQRDSDIVVTKRTWGAFTGTGLGDKLKALGISQVVVTGVATSIGVESTARQAHELGLHVTLAIDAMTDLNPDAHANSILRIFPRLGETGTTAEIINLLETSQG